jgi:hypothetical protein
VPTVLAGRLRGDGLDGAGFPELIYFINVDIREQQVVVEGTRGRPFELHPVHTAPTAADRRPVQSARFDAALGRFSLPPRTAVVWVLKPAAARPGSASR